MFQFGSFILLTCVYRPMTKPVMACKCTNRTSES